MFFQRAVGALLNELGGATEGLRSLKVGCLQLASNVLVNLQNVLQFKAFECVAFLLQLGILRRHVINNVKLPVFALADRLNAFEVNLHFELLAINHQKVVLLLFQELKAHGDHG